MWEKLKELKKYEAMEKNKEQMSTLTHDLLSCRAPSLSYPVFLFEHMILFQIKALNEGLDNFSIFGNFHPEWIFWAESFMWDISAL